MDLQRFQYHEGAQITSQDFTDLLDTTTPASAWTAVAGSRTTSLSNGSGGPLSISICIWHSFENGTALHIGLAEWFLVYNEERSHQTFDILTPDEVYMGLTAPVIQAA